MENGTNSLAERLQAILTDDTMRRLVDAFYPRVAKDPDLRPIFPDDLTEIADKQYMFLTQFFGGRPLYSEVYGQPAMKLRHMPHEITPTRAKAWLRLMSEAMEEVGIDGELKEFMHERLTHVGYFMVNTPD